jgi:GntR family transcriptional regulator, transcriptional repressor for pyruvate dehydrogenase complex
MTFKNIKRDSTSEKIIQQIKEQIKAGVLKTGEKLPSERQLSEIMGVSRTSVREAIQALAFSGYLNVIQGKGAYITEDAKTHDQLNNLIENIPDMSLDTIMEVRIMFEGEFARLAAIRATEEEIEEINRHFQEMKDANTTSLFVLKDWDFHLSVAKATHNQLMNTLMNILGGLLHKETSKIIKYSETTKDDTIRITEKLIMAFRNRDSEKAKELMIEHLKVINRIIEANNLIKG